MILLGKSIDGANMYLQQTICFLQGGSGLLGASIYVRTTCASSKLENRLRVAAGLKKK